MMSEMMVILAIISIILVITSAIVIEGIINNLQAAVSIINDNVAFNIHF